MRFEWDRDKADGNVRKHGITFNEAASVFYDPTAATFDDPEHSIGQHRFITIGHSRRGRLLVVVHAELASALRIISARLASAQERRRHET
jgi:uncharacterized DUF497 family protein